MTEQKIGRLALRQEGGLWVAYYAQTETMEGALFLGSIVMKAVTENMPRRIVFMEMMRDIVGDLITEATGQRPVWLNDAVTAPENERGGNG